jgi:hypothetical protein
MYPGFSLAGFFPLFWNSLHQCCAIRGHKLKEKNLNFVTSINLCVIGLECYICGFMLYLNNNHQKPLQYVFINLASTDVINLVAIII